MDLGSRTKDQLALVRAAIEALGADSVVVFGSCALSFFIDADKGPPLKTTHDADVVHVLPTLVECRRHLDELVKKRVLSPVARGPIFRYRVVRTGTLVDVIDLHGGTIRVSDVFREAVEHAVIRNLDGYDVRVIPPEYQFATKLEAVLDRGRDPAMDTDAEDLIAIIVEIEDIVERVRNAGVRDLVSTLIADIEARFGVAFEDLFDFHVHPDQWGSVPRVRDAIQRLRSSRG